jgi:multiple sugar transport system permease protein
VRKISRLGAEAKLGWALVAPALAVIALIAIFPLGWTFWESLHLHELRMPWLGKPFIGIANYLEIAKDPRFWAALGHTAFFTVVSISLELLIGLFLALAMNRVFRGRGFVRAAVLVPWAIPTVVSSQMWRYIFNDRYGLFNFLLFGGATERYLAPLADAWPARAAIVFADVWKTSRSCAIPC